VNVDLNEQQNIKLGILQSKKSVNVDLNEQQNIKLEFHKLKKV